MEEPKWVKEETALAVHDEVVRQFGGSHGTRERGGLETALARPLQRYAYGKDPDLAELAAAYAFSLAKMHPFVDGNKRTAYEVMRVFLRINGIQFRPPDAEIVEQMIALAAGDIEEEAFADWIRGYI